MYDFAALKKMAAQIGKILTSKKYGKDKMRVKYENTIKICDKKGYHEITKLGTIIQIKNINNNVVFSNFYWKIPEGKASDYNMYLVVIHKGISYTAYWRLDKVIGVDIVLWNLKWKDIVNKNIDLLYIITGPNAMHQTCDEKFMVDVYDIDQSFCDIAFACNDGKKVTTFKSLLATISPVFNNMFFGKGKFKPVECIDFNEYESSVVKKLVQFAVDRNYDPCVEDFDFIVLCDRYIIKSVVNSWADFMCSNINTSNVVKTFTVARIIDSEKLLVATKRFIKEQGQNIKNLHELDKDDLLKILSL